MTFWIAAAALTGLTCLALLSALARKPPMAKAEGHDRAFYDQQVAEIDRQLALKLIGDREAEAARAEAARRLLAAAREEERVGASTGGSSNLAAAAVLVLVPAIALPIYMARGAPDQPSLPLASRERAVAGEGASTDIAAALQQIEAHLMRNPDDGRGHDVVAPVYLRLGRVPEAVRAYEAAIRLLGSTAERQSSLGEALVVQSDGVVTAAAKAAFEAAASLDARHAKTRFFLAMAAQQEGDKPKAIELLTKLRDDLPDDPLKAEISRQLVALGAPPKSGETIAALPAQERDAAIRSMVEGLAQRLATTGGTADEWARLIRALTVLSETERAGAILAEARQKFAADPDALRRIEAAGRAP
jgi:cytochrome c-type biogenesis protein CcmH